MPTDTGRRIRGGWIGVVALLVFIVVLVVLISLTLGTIRPAGMPGSADIDQIDMLDVALNVELTRHPRRNALNKSRMVGLLDGLDSRINRLANTVPAMDGVQRLKAAVDKVRQQWRHKHEWMVVYLGGEVDDEELHLRLLSLTLSDSLREVKLAIDAELRAKREQRDNTRLALGLWLALGLLVGIWRLRADGKALRALNGALEAEARMREEASQEYQQLVENANSAIVRMDAQMRVTYFNPYAERLFGFEADEIIGLPVIGSFLPERDQEGRDYAHILQDLLKRPERYDHLELENRNQDGSPRWCLWNVKQVVHNDSREILAIGTDMTQHRRAESLVLTQNRILSEVARGESVGYLYQSVCKLVRYRVHNALCTVHTRIAGREDERELIGVDVPPVLLDSLVAWDYQPDPSLSEHDLEFLELSTPALKGIAASMRENDVVQVWIRPFGAEGHRGFIAVWLSEEGRLPDGREREVLFSAGMIAGITAERDHLDRQLRAAKEEAEMNAATKSSFLARMSHEIRTPMSGLIGVLTLLKDRTDIPYEPGQHLTMAYNSAESLLALLDDILDMSKIESGKLVIESVPCQLRDLTEEVAELFAQRAASKGVLLITHVDYSLPGQVLADPTRIRQVISNLVGNAVKFTDSGEIEVSLEVKGRSSSGVDVRFAVRDTGIGIPEEARTKIFESFVQAKSSTTRKYGGTGLGLPLSRDLVSRMGGELEVKSKAGHGSVFEFTLTLACDDEHPLTGVDGLADRQALLIDASISRVRALQEHLTAFGLECVTRPDRASGGAYLDGQSCDVVIDALAPGLGDEVAWMDRCGELGLGVVRIDGRAFGEQSSVSGYRHVSTPVRSGNLRDALLAVLSDDVVESGNEPVEPRDEPPTKDGLSKGRILLVEDQEVNRLVARGLLEKLGYLPDEVENGDLAVKAVQKHDYDLVLMDCEMPILDGYGATESIRKQEVGSDVHVPIVALTAHALPEHRERCLSVGMDDYLAKPYKLHDLRLVIERWLDGPGAAAEEAKQQGSGEVEPISPAEPSESAQEVGGSAIDLEEFQDILDTFGEDIIQLIDSFDEVLPRKLKGMRDALDSGDSESLRSEAHALKGIANTVAARPSGLLCKALEDAGRSGELEGAAQTLARLETESSRAMAALREAVKH